MARQSISLTKPNDQWLKSLVESEEYSSKSEIVNDLIRKERDRQNELIWLRAKLQKSEDRLLAEGPVTQTPEELLVDIKKVARDNGQL
ncbi:CopG family transcriptional regulator [Arenibacter sp. M-2]|uniref:ribbon-helix-helix domain-containing protein n=1 Tax=Arenibacter sp. M-2 TaxID=3053612 RepID=UPI00256FBD52|nr:CopG family transcriptional regulator [Arenibacter sp. M-2]MDL5512684.1 CopG family transcriptional regulator [Arenibacter sp. M-2]